MDEDFRLLMIGAMYENGGNTAHRFLDGHPEMYVYPFESQFGTRLVSDHMSAIFPVKYRWPVFDLEATPYQDYKAIIDEECKVRARTPHVSKFRGARFDFSDDHRLQVYERMVGETGRSRANNIAAFFRATFEAWNDYRKTGEESFYVGYSPALVVDAEKIFADFPTSHFLHVVRNPWSAYAETQKRPVPLTLEHYMLGWMLNQHYALLFKAKYPDRLHIMRIEDLMADPLGALAPLCQTLGLRLSPTLHYPSFNGEELTEVYPWGTIRRATPEANRATAEELHEDVRETVRLHAWKYLDAFGYSNFFD